MRAFKIFFPLLIVALLSLYSIGTLLTKANPSTVGAIPDDIERIRAVSFASKSGSTLKGWLLEAKQGKGGVLLLHGVRSSRLQMLNRARFLQKEGYDVLLFDFQAHGESEGEQITFGHLESLDVERAYDYLEDRLCNQTIAVIGVSLGGASALLSSVKTRAKVMILESVYPSIEQAIDDRMRIYLGAVGHYFSPLLTLQLKPRLGIGVDDLRPVDAVRNVTGATLFIVGEKDLHTPLKESKAMFKKAHEPKVLWVVKGAKHVDFDALLGKEYEEKILSFLEEHME